MNQIYAIMDILLPFSWLSPSFMKNAFLAVLLASPLFGALGTVVVSNQMAFFSDAIGHSALTGIAFGVLLGIPDPTVAMILFSILLGFLIITVKNRGGVSTDTIIGVFSSTAAAIGLALLSVGGGFAKYSRYLIGDILSILPEELLFLLCTGAFFLFVWIFFYNKMLISSVHRTLAKSRRVHVFRIEVLFALLTAVIVTVSIRWTGLLVINSLLVLPAASARMVTRSSRSYIKTATLISIAASLCGLIISFYVGTAAGAAIVLVNAVFFIVCFAVSCLPATGVLPEKQDERKTRL